MLKTIYFIIIFAYLALAGCGGGSDSNTYRLISAAEITQKVQNIPYHETAEVKVNVKTISKIAAASVSSANWVPYFISGNGFATATKKDNNTIEVYNNNKSKQSQIIEIQICDGNGNKIGDPFSIRLLPELDNNGQKLQIKKGNSNTTEHTWLAIGPSNNNTPDLKNAIIQALYITFAGLLEANEKKPGKVKLLEKFTDAVKLQNKFDPKKFKETTIIDIFKTDGTDKDHINAEEMLKLLNNLELSYTVFDFTCKIDNKNNQQKVSGYTTKKSKIQSKNTIYLALFKNNVLVLQSKDENGLRIKKELIDKLPDLQNSEDLHTPDKVNPDKDKPQVPVKEEKDYKEATREPAAQQRPIDTGKTQNPKDDDEKKIPPPRPRPRPENSVNILVEALQKKVEQDETQKAPMPDGSYGQQLNFDKIALSVILESENIPQGIKIPQSINADSTIDNFDKAYQFIIKKYIEVYHHTHPDTKYDLDIANTIKTEIEKIFTKFTEKVKNTFAQIKKVNSENLNFTVIVQPLKDDLLLKEIVKQLYQENQKTQQTKLGYSDIYHYFSQQHQTNNDLTKEQYISQEILNAMHNNGKYAEISDKIKKTKKSSPAKQQKKPEDQAKDQAGEENNNTLIGMLKREISKRSDQNEQPIEQQAEIENNNQHDIKLNDINQLLNQRELQQNNQQPLEGRIPPPPLPPSNEIPTPPPIPKLLNAGNQVQVIDIAQKIGELKNKQTSIGNITLFALLEKLKTGGNTQITTAIYNQAEGRANNLDFNDTANLDTLGRAQMLEKLPTALEKINDYIIAEYIKMNYSKDQTLIEKNTRDILNAVIDIDNKVITQIQEQLTQKGQKSIKLDLLKTKIIDKFKDFNAEKTKLDDTQKQIGQADKHEEKTILWQQKQTVENALKTYKQQSEYEQKLQKVIQTKWNYLKSKNQKPLQITTSTQKNNQEHTFENLKTELRQKYDAVAQKIDNQIIKQAIEKLKKQIGSKRDGKLKDTKTLEIELKGFKEEQFLTTLIENMPELEVIQIAQAQDFENLSNTIKNAVIEKIKDIYKTRTQVDATDLFNPIQAIPKYDDFDFDQFLNQHQPQPKETTNKLPDQLEGFEKKQHKYDPNAPEANGNAPLVARQENTANNHPANQPPIDNVAATVNQRKQPQMPQPQLEAEGDNIPAHPPLPLQTAAENKKPLDTKQKPQQELELQQQIQQHKPKQDPNIQTAKKSLQKLGVEDIVDQNEIIRYAKETGVDIANNDALDKLYKQIQSQKQQGKPLSIKAAINALKNADNPQAENQHVNDTLDPLLRALLNSPMLANIDKTPDNSDSEEESDNDTWDDGDGKIYAKEQAEKKAREAERKAIGRQQQNQQFTPNKIPNKNTLAPTAHEDRPIQAVPISTANVNLNDFNDIMSDIMKKRRAALVTKDDNDDNDDSDDEDAFDFDN